MADASVDKTREAGTTGSPKQDIAELISSTSGRAGPFLIFLLDASHNLSLNPIGSCYFK